MCQANMSQNRISSTVKVKIGLRSHNWHEHRPNPSFTRTASLGYSNFTAAINLCKAYRRIEIELKMQPKSPHQYNMQGFTLR